MVRRSVHYEAAFEDYLRAKGLPYVGVDEGKKAIFRTAKLKSFDFIVYSETGLNLLIDVKGRKFPDSVSGRHRGGVKAWENWVTRDDIEGLTQWGRVFGAQFQPVFVFAYWLQGPPERSPLEEVHFFRKNYYAFVAVSLGEYIQGAKPRSEKWQTLGMPSAKFAKIARDVADLL